MLTSHAFRRYNRYGINLALETTFASENIFELHAEKFVPPVEKELIRELNSVAIDINSKNEEIENKAREHSRPWMNFLDRVKTFANWNQQKK